MKKIIPFKYVDEALSTLDNGGRFYNFLTKQNDGIISQAELGKVGSVFNDKQKMILYFELSTSDLDTSKKELLLSKMEDKLQESYKKFKPELFLPSEAREKGVLSKSAILKGIPKLTTSKTKFNGFIMVPISTGNVTTFTMIPIIDVYDVYELRDDSKSETFMIAHARSKEKLPERKIKVAGVFKELKANKDEDSDSNIFLEAVYYSDLS